MQTLNTLLGGHLYQFNAVAILINSFFFPFLIFQFVINSKHKIYSMIGAFIILLVLIFPLACGFYSGTKSITLNWDTLNSYVLVLLPTALFSFSLIGIKQKKIIFKLFGFIVAICSVVFLTGLLYSYQFVGA